MLLIFYAPGVGKTLTTAKLSAKNAQTSFAESPAAPTDETIPTASTAPSRHIITSSALAKVRVFFILLQTATERSIDRASPSQRRAPSRGFLLFWVAFL